MLRKDIITNSNTSPEIVEKKKTSSDAMISHVNFSIDMPNKDTVLFVSNRLDFCHLMEIL